MTQPSKKTPLDVAEAMTNSAYLPHDLKGDFCIRVAYAIHEKDFEEARRLTDEMRPHIEELKRVARNFETKLGINYKDARRLAHQARAAKAEYAQAKQRNNAKPRNSATKQRSENNRTAEWRARKLAMSTVPDRQRAEGADR